MLTLIEIVQGLLEKFESVISFQTESTDVGRRVIREAALSSEEIKIN